MNNGEIPAPYQDSSTQTQYPSGADSWLGRESGLPRPSFPNVGRIPKTPFEIDVRVTSKDGKPYTYYEGDFRPHAFYGKRTEEGVLIYPGLLVSFISDITGSSGSSPPGLTTAVPQIYTPAGMATGSPVVVTGASGDIVCLCGEIYPATSLITDVEVRVETPSMISAQDGGTLAIEIGTLTDTGFLQKLRSDFFYSSLTST